MTNKEKDDCLVRQGDCPCRIVWAAPNVLDAQVKGLDHWFLDDNPSSSSKSSAAASILPATWRTQSTATEVQGTATEVCAAFDATSMEPRRVYTLIEALAIVPSRGLTTKVAKAGEVCWIPGRAHGQALPNRAGFKHKGVVDRSVF